MKSLFLMLDQAKVKGFSTSNRGRATTVRVEIETSDPDTLACLLRELQNAQAKPEMPKPPVRPKSLALPAPRRALAAPLLSLPAPGDE